MENSNLGNALEDMLREMAASSYKEPLLLSASDETLRKLGLTKAEVECRPERPCVRSETPDNAAAIAAAKREVIIQYFLQKPLGSGNPLD